MTGSIPRFHGVDRVIFAVDEWQHRAYLHLPDFLHEPWFRIWRPLCNWWDRRLNGQPH